VLRLIYDVLKKFFPHLLKTRYYFGCRWYSPDYSTPYCFAGNKLPSRFTIESGSMLGRTRLTESSVNRLLTLDLIAIRCKDGSFGLYFKHKPTKMEIRQIKTLCGVSNYVKDKLEGGDATDVIVHTDDVFVGKSRDLTDNSWWAKLSTPLVLTPSHWIFKNGSRIYEYNNGSARIWKGQRIYTEVTSLNQVSSDPSMKFYSPFRVFSHKLDRINFVTKISDVALSSNFKLYLPDMRLNVMVKVPFDLPKGQSIDVSEVYQTSKDVLTDSSSDEEDEESDSTEIVIEELHIPDNINVIDNSDILEPEPVKQGRKLFVFSKFIVLLLLPFSATVSFLCGCWAYVAAKLFITRLHYFRGTTYLSPKNRQAAKFGIFGAFVAVSIFATTGVVAASIVGLSLKYLFSKYKGPSQALVVRAKKEGKKIRGYGKNKMNTKAKRIVDKVKSKGQKVKPLARAKSSASTMRSDYNSENSDHWLTTLYEDNENFYHKSFRDDYEETFFGDSGGSLSGSSKSKPFTAPVIVHQIDRKTGKKVELTLDAFKKKQSQLKELATVHSKLKPHSHVKIFMPSQFIESKALKNDQLKAGLDGKFGLKLFGTTQKLGLSNDLDDKYIVTILHDKKTPEVKKTYTAFYGEVNNTDCFVIDGVLDKKGLSKFKEGATDDDVRMLHAKSKPFEHVGGVIVHVGEFCTAGHLDSGVHTWTKGYPKQRTKTPKGKRAEGSKGDSLLVKYMATTPIPKKVKDKIKLREDESKPLIDFTNSKN